VNADLTGVRHSTVAANGIELHVAEAGPADGPLVVLLHGFPECWYSWRHQFAPLAAAGWHVVAPDQRGYGPSSAPEPVEAYSQLHLVGDVVGLFDAFGAETAVVVGHDWGGPVAWNTALLRPDRVRAVVGLSVAFFGVTRAEVPPTAHLAAQAGDRFLYILYFQQPGVAEAELERDTRASLRRMLYSLSGDIPRDRFRFWDRPAGSVFLDTTVEPPQLPAWLTEDDLDVFTASFERSGFRGGLNWYRNIDRSSALMAAFAGRTVPQPALFVAGEHDVVLGTTPETVRAGMAAAVPRLRGAHWLPGCGHWVQQERPAELNALLLEFLAGL
jgi:pimeloyl-ACP methyl ester carboxylesterase